MTAIELLAAYIPFVSGLEIAPFILALRFALRSEIIKYWFQTLDSETFHSTLTMWTKTKKLSTQRIESTS